MHSVCPCSLPVWRRSFLKKWTPRYLFWPRPGSTPGRIWPKNNNTCKGPWVLHAYQVSSKSIKQFWRRSWKCEKFTPDAGRRRQTDGRTDGRCAMTIAHLSLWLRWAKNFSCYHVHKVKREGRTDVLTHPTTDERPHYYIPFNTVARGCCCEGIIRKVWSCVYERLVERKRRGCPTIGHGLKAIISLINVLSCVDFIHMPWMSKSFKCKLSVTSGKAVQGARWESEGSLVRFQVGTYIWIFRLFLFLTA